MTLAQAIEACVKVHKGQRRRRWYRAALRALDVRRLDAIPRSEIGLITDNIFPRNG